MEGRTYTMRTITYAIHMHDGYVVSQVGDELAWPVLDFDAIGKGGRNKCVDLGEEGEKLYAKGDFHGPTRFDLDKLPVLECREYRHLVWTRKVPLTVKNYHRAFWGMKSLKRETVVPCEKCSVRLPITEMRARRVRSNPDAWSRVQHRCPDCAPDCAPRVMTLA